MKYSVLILAAGKGSRTQLNYNKVFFTFEDGEVLLQKTLRPFLHDADCTQLIVVTTKEEEDEVKASLVDDARMVFVYGGETRQESVYNGLLKVREDIVMIHDGARCFVSPQELARCKQAMVHERACLLMVPVIDTVKIVREGYVVSTPLRQELYAAQTPQCFASALIRECHKRAQQEGYIGSDDASLVERYSDAKVCVVHGEYRNKKVTLQEDLK